MAPARTETATLGGGCFWCLEATFELLGGVEKVVSGYAGGSAANPSYEAVCSGRTGHAEVVQVTFDPAVIPYRELLKVFFSIHDPTTKDRQGADVGTQYRSIILFHTAEQKEAAQKLMNEIAEQKVWDRPLVTQLEPLRAFFPAEEYHQGYYRRNPRQGYCQAIISPKVAKLRKQWAARLKVPA
jgi:peptide-methionine (S)-S-oxide reductase